MAKPSAKFILDRQPPAGSGGERDRIVSLHAGCSLETSVRDPLGVDRFRDQVAPGTDLYVNHHPGESYHQTIAVAARLRRLGFNPVPHLGARSFAGFTPLRDCLERLQGEAGVREMPVVAGDLDRPMGPYASSLDLLETGLLQKAGIRRVYVAGYPERHQRIGAASLASALHAKQALAREVGLELAVLTQFCFEADPILTWIAAMRAAGIGLPIRVGLAGPASLRALLKFALRCGLGASVRALGSDASSIAHLVTLSGPDSLVRDLANATGARRDIESLHFFPFGGVGLTAAWIRAVAAGCLELPDHHPGFSVRG